MNMRLLFRLALLATFLITQAIPTFSQGQSDANRVNIWELMERRDLRLQEIDAIAKRYFDAVGRERGTGFKQYER